jgi:hypothetical protein
VEQDERALEPGDDHVLVVPRISDDRGSVARAREVLERPSALDPQLRPIVRHVELT